MIVALRCIHGNVAMPLFCKHSLTLQKSNRTLVRTESVNAVLTFWRGQSSRWLGEVNLKGRSLRYSANETVKPKRRFGRAVHPQCHRVHVIFQSISVCLTVNQGETVLKTQQQLKALIDVARAQKTRGALEGYMTDGDDKSSTNSWGPQMRV